VYRPTVSTIFCLLQRRLEHVAPDVTKVVGQCPVMIKAPFPRLTLRHFRRFHGEKPVNSKVRGIPSILCSLQMNLGDKIITTLIGVTLLGLFAKLGKATKYLSHVSPLSLSLFAWNNSASNRRIFMKFYI